MKNAIELFKLLNQNRDFINAVFESNNRQMHINSVLGLIDQDELDHLESLELVDIYENQVSLDEHLIQFLESHLIDSFNEELYDYASIFKKIDKSVELYYASDSFLGNTEKHIRNIHRQLRRIPSNLLDALKSIQMEVEFSYRSAVSAEEKLRELKSYNEELTRFDKVLSNVRSELKKHSGFFAFVNDESIDFQRVRLSSYIQNIYDTLIKITQTVLEYIQNTEKNIQFHKHITDLKELRDRKEIVDKTNLYDLVINSKSEPLISGFTKVQKKNKLIKLYPEYAYEPEFEERILKRGEQTTAIGKLEASSVAIPLEMMESEEVVIINYSSILFEYLDKEYNNETFLSYLSQKEPSLMGYELLDVYLDVIISNSEEVQFLEEQYEQIADYDCISVIPKLQNLNITQTGY